MRFIILKKRTNFASSKLLRLFFTLNSVVFLDRERKNISCPRAQGTLVTPLSPNRDRPATGLAEDMKTKTCLMRSSDN